MQASTVLQRQKIIIDTPATSQMVPGANTNHVMFRNQGTSMENRPNPWTGVAIRKKPKVEIVIYILSNLL